MDTLLFLTGLFLLPLGLFAIMTAILGFLWPPLFAPMLATGGLGVVGLGRAIMPVEPFGPFLLFPLLLASAVAMAGSVGLRKAMEAGFAQDSAGMAMQEEEGVD